jgi:type IV fimbrial biogenesis protein FimT
LLDQGKGWHVLIANHRHNSGFTLIELMITIALLGILSFFAIPSYRTWIQNTQIRGGAEAILNGIQLARAEAVQRNTNTQFVLGSKADWTVQTASGTAIQTRTSQDGSPNVTVAVTPAGATTITFNAFGRVQNANAINRIDVDSSVLSAADSREMRITIGAGGNIRMCDPNLTVSSPNDPRAC